MLQPSQSLLELLVALTIFAILVPSFSFFVLQAYLSWLLSKDLTTASFLAEEGIEATRSIRDHSFEDLIPGSHGLLIFEGRWVFQGDEENISQDLKEGKRIIKIEDIGSGRKKITSQIQWQAHDQRFKEISLVTYFTNWQGS